MDLIAMAWGVDARRDDGVDEAHLQEIVRRQHGRRIEHVIQRGERLNVEPTSPLFRCFYDARTRMRMM